MSRTSLDRGVATAFWTAVAGGSVVLVASFVAVPTVLLVGGWTLFVASVAAVFVLAVVGSRREAVGVGRVLARGMRAAFGWIVAFLP